VMIDENLKRRRIQSDLEMLMDNNSCYVENHVGRQTVSQLEPFVLKLPTQVDGSDPRFY
jgi:hypothetical protein